MDIDAKATDNPYDKTIKDIIEFGDVKESDLLKVLNIMELSPYQDLSGFQAKSSNGTSFVCIKSDIPLAYQYFNNHSTSSKIYTIVSSCDSKIKYTIYVDNKTYFCNEYDLFDFIPRIKNYIEPSNLIIWEKILPLNALDNSRMKELIEKNIIKLLWDIAKALHGLHINNIYHGDARIDNIGIKNENFILFDFDGSKKVDSLDTQIMSKDYRDFVRSIKFNLNDEATPDRFKNVEQFIPDDIDFFLISLLENESILNVLKLNSHIVINNTQDVIKMIECVKIV